MIPARSVAVDQTDLAGEINRACGHMTQHGLIAEQDGVWTIQEGQTEAVHFYANSIAHYLIEAHGLSNAAYAKDFSAPAGS